MMQNTVVRMWRYGALVAALLWAASSWAGVVHAPDFAVNHGGYSVQGTGVTLSADSAVTPLGNTSLRVDAVSGASGVLRGATFVITATHRNGYAFGNNLAYWNVRYYIKTSGDFTGSYRIVARILDDKDYTHGSDPDYDQTGEPFELPFENYGGAATTVNGFTCVNKPICALCTTHPNNRNTSGNNDVEFTVYLSGATGSLWLSGVRIETAMPHTGAFTDANWNLFENSAGDHYLTFMGHGLPEYSPPGWCSDLIIDTGLKLLRVAGFNQGRVPIYWGDHFSRPEAKIMVENSQPDGSGDYEASLDVLEDVVDEMAHYGISPLLLLRGTPDWTHPLHHNNVSDGPHNGLSNPGNPNGLGDPYPGPQNAVGDHRTYPPDDWQDWRDYVAALVTRLQGKVAGYEIFNEINVPAQAGVIGGYKAVTEYVRHFAEAAYAIDSQAVVMPGAMDKMLAGCVADGILNHANAVSYHGYSGDLLGTRGIVESCGEKKHVWMTEHHGLHPELWMTTREQGNWNAFSASGWAIKDQYKILVLQDATGAWVNSSMPAGLGDRVMPVQDYHEFGYMAGVFTPGGVSGDSGDRIVATVEAPAKVQYGTSVRVTLRAHNQSSQTFHNVRLWPVGFVDNLGFDKSAVRAAEMTIAALAPGESREIIMTVHPTTTQYQAAGVYHVGLAVVNDERKHSLVYEALEVAPFGALCATMLPGDLNYDCRVDMDDLQLMAGDWLADADPG